MRVCFIASEFFSYGAYGGYGRLIRTLARGLHERGVETWALIRKMTPESLAAQPEVEEVEGTTVIALPKRYAARCRRMDLFRAPQADLYVSMEPRFDSWLAMRANPHAKHAVIFGAPRDFREYWLGVSRDPRKDTLRNHVLTAIQYNLLRLFANRVVRRADTLFAHGQTIANTAASLYNLPTPPTFLPNPVAIPDGPLEKSTTPSVLFLGRWDEVKRPERFFQMAERFPNVRFIAAGKAANPERDALLREKAALISNLFTPGHIDGAEKGRWLRESWVLANTSVFEGMPLAFQEGLAYGCALLAPMDADSLPSRFGHLVTEDAFEEGLAWLLEDNRWRERGAAGREYMARTHGTFVALDKTMLAFERIVYTQDGFRPKSR